MGLPIQQLVTSIREYALIRNKGDSKAQLMESIFLFNNSISTFE
jgi:hypothetical protein